MRADDLRGEPLRIYEAWLSCGYTEAQALEEVARSGVTAEQEMAELFENMGLPGDVARTAARGRRGPVGDPFDQMAEVFKTMGLSPEQARKAAIGRYGTESEARRAFTPEPKPTPQAAPPPSVPEIVERTDALTRQGVPLLEARRRAYREMYGSNPKGAA
ncbi:hypothetical protein ACIBO2_26200 [Nonomuraea sp. NPDC050022]|uniref:hypothetical protein n=1 Tax=Nonomuraea sp. NPDC050022 TaxID=3364358 RepID=UPI0037ABC171